MTLPPALPAPAAPNANGYTPRHVSPYGAVVGLRDRLAKWRDRMASDHSLPWAGLGIIKDITAVVQLLDVREFAEWLRVHGSPDQQGFGDEILANEETLACLNDVLKPGGEDPVKVAEDLTKTADAYDALLAAVEVATNREFGPAEAVKAVQTLNRESAEGAAMRAVLVDVGALAPNDVTTDTAALLRALLS